MTNAIIRRVILLGAISILSLLSVQTYWILRTWDLQEREFNRKVNQALLDAANQNLQGLHEANPHDEQVALDLSVSLINLGDFYLRRGAAGDAERALEFFQAAAALRRVLAQTNPGAGALQAELCVPLMRLAQTLLQLEHWDAFMHLIGEMRALVAHWDLQGFEPDGRVQAVRDLLRQVDEAEGKG